MYAEHHIENTLRNKKLITHMPIKGPEYRIPSPQSADSVPTVQSETKPKPKTQTQTQVDCNPQRALADPRDVVDALALA